MLSFIWLVLMPHLALFHLNPILASPCYCQQDIIYHESTHGVTRRMLWDVSGLFSQAVGEGASDAVAFLLNGDDRIAASVRPPNGIRRYRYQGYPLTYRCVCLCVCVCVCVW